MTDKIVSRYLPSDQVKVDKKDERIIAELQKDCRTPATTISKKVFLSRDAVEYRIKRLQEKEVITLFYPRIDYKKLGFSLFHVFYLIDEVSSKRKQELLNYLQCHNNILSLIEYSDKWDLQVTFLAKNIDEFDNILSDVSIKFPELILEKDTMQLITRYYSVKLPNDFVKNTTKPEIKSEGIIDLDKKDSKILELLSQDARRSSYNIGRIMKISSDSVRYRIKKMESQGVIKQFGTIYNLAKLNYIWYTTGIQMKKFDPKNEIEFKEFISKHPFIIRGIKTLGVWDLLLYIVARNPTQFHTTLKEIKKQFSNIIRTYDVWIAYKEHYFNPFPECLKIN